MIFPEDIMLTVNILLKHPRNGLPPTVLYNVFTLHYTLQLIYLI